MSSPRETPITIVIPAFNQVDFCRQCVESLRANTARAHRLVLVDNGSTDGVSEYFDSVPGAVVVHTGENLGFAGGVNRGLDHAEGHVVLLNSDTVTPRGWLSRLEQALCSADDWGIIGPVTNYAAGPQQIDGLSLRSLEEIEAYAGRRAEEYGDSVREVNRLIGFCMMIRADLFREVGALDERFAVGNFEDDDYCMRARKAGWRLAVAEGCFVFHYGGRTFAGMGLEGEKFDAVMRANQQRYEDKWGFKLPPNIPPDRLARDLNRRAREALVRGDAAEAVRHLRAAVAAAPNDSRHHSDLGAALWQLDRRELAFACFLQALRCDAADPDALANARDAARALGREAELDAALADGD